MQKEGSNVSVIYPTGNVYCSKGIYPDEDPVARQLRFEFIDGNGKIVYLPLNILIQTYMYAAKHGAAKKCTADWQNSVFRAYNIPDDFHY